MSWSRWAEEQLTAIASRGRWRSARTLDAFGPTGQLTEDGRGVVSFASNDYLGLSSHPEVLEAAVEAVYRWGSGSGSARLIAGSRPVHDELEAELAAWRDAEAAALFSSGYSANLGVLCTFADEGTLICSDELNHASIIDGCRLAAGSVAVYRHRDVEHLQTLLAGRQRAIVVSDSVFSMDGDVAPVEDLVETCAAAGALLVLDEAHAVLGPYPDLGTVDALRVGTLSKTLGALGGFVAGPRRFVDLLVNRARSYIFTTALTPADTAAALAALRVLRSPEGEALKGRLGEHAARLGGGPSPILPVVLGEEAAAVKASAELLDRGMFVPAIRPPTVPPGSSRLRITLSASHTRAQVERLAAALGELGARRLVGA